MEKREKVLLGLVAATALAAGITLLSGPSRPPVASAPASAAGLDDVVRDMERAKLTPELTYRLSVLTQSTTVDPFYGRVSAIAQDNASQGGDEMVYSGYMKIGNKLFAVIDGIEYACGDRLADGDYVLSAIERNAVLLERTDSASGRKYTKRIPLVEDDADKIRVRVVKQR